MTDHQSFWLHFSHILIGWTAREGALKRHYFKKQSTFSLSVNSGDARESRGGSGNLYNVSHVNFVVKSPLTDDDSDASFHWLPITIKLKEKEIKKY